MRHKFIRSKHKYIAARNLLRLFYFLLESLGSQNWWPGDRAFEIMVGAILTQNTNWENVARSIAELKSTGMLSPHQMYNQRRRLPKLIRSSGYFRLKSKRLINYVKYYLDKYQGSIKKMARISTGQLRAELLILNGIGYETADSILLYALNRPVFVIDAYTRRILIRHRLINPADQYMQIQHLFHTNIPADVRIYNEYHALLVYVGKNFCRKNDPDCTLCPIDKF